MKEGGYADEERMPQGTGIDHVRAGIITGRACRPAAGVIRPGRSKALLMVGLEEEATAVLKRLPYERSQGNIRGYRNGHRERQVSCGAGIIEVPVPRVSGTKETFRSQLLEARQRRNRLLPRDDSSPLCRGIIDQGFQTGAQATMGRERPLPLQRFTGKQSSQGSLQQLAPPRPIPRRDNLPLPGRHLPGDKEAVLVAHSITSEGKRVVLHLNLGGRESTESWKGVLNDLVERGLRRPQLLITDGNQDYLRR